MLIDTVVCLTLAKWETVSGRFGGYLIRTKFPANREFNREFCKFGASAAISASNQRANSKACRQIPYATEQGIFAAITGNFFGITGNLIERAGKALSCCRTSN